MNKEFFRKRSQKTVAIFLGIWYNQFVILERRLFAADKNGKGQKIMLNLTSLLIPTSGNLYYVHRVLSISMIALMAIAAIVAIILILLQPSNSTGIDALGGSSETFFGKHKGKSIEAKMKRWTWICLAVLVVFSIAFYILQIDALWS